MNKALLATLALASLSSPSFSEDVPKSLYVTGGLGKSFVSDIDAETIISSTRYDLNADMENSSIFKIGLGKHLNDHWRIEGAFSKSQTKQLDVTASTGGSSATATLDVKPEYDLKGYMVNVYRDFGSIAKAKNITPYLGVGAGMTNVKMETYTSTIAGTDVEVTDPGRSLFTYSLKAGASLEVNDRSDFFTEASFNAMEQFNEDSIYYNEISNVDVIAGYRYRF